MLPGLIAGHYSEEDIHIDLRRLCVWAGVRFIEQTLTSLDLQARLVQVDDQPPIGFDVLSLDTGSTPELSIPGATEFTTPVKPVFHFHARWKKLLSRLADANTSKMTIGVVGSGAGGFELITAICHALPDDKATCQWFVRGELPLGGRPERVGRLALGAAGRQGVEVFTGVDVKQVENGCLIAGDGRRFELDEILWCTAATGPDWPALAGLDIDTQGFVVTNQYLQSTSHPFVFATGDVGTQQQTPSAKAGVFAVRQAPVLFDNIRRFLLNIPLKTYKPQKNFLSLMATGDKRAIASRGPIALEASWIWQWKDCIDQRFMQRFKALPPMTPNESLNRLPDALLDERNASHKPNAMRCKGCGSKVSSRVLDRVLARLHISTSSGFGKNLSPAADAAAIAIKAGTLVQSVDQIDSIVDDPYLLGRIAVLHAMSDVVTLNATPHSAQVMVTLPAASEALTERDLERLMSGIANALEQEQCTLLGGHTNQGAELEVGIVVNAMLPESSGLKLPQPVRDGDALVLSQGLGIGTLFAGLMQGSTRGADIQSAMQAMLSSNRIAARIVQQHDARAITDVTGFGLLGHMERLLNGLGSGNGAVVHLRSVPFLPGAVKTAMLGVRSSLWPSNSAILKRVDSTSVEDADQLSLLCDPQTSGGLLAIVPAAQQTDCIMALHAAGYTDAAVIGTANGTGSISIR